MKTLVVCIVLLSSAFPMVSPSSSSPQCAVCGMLVDVKSPFSAQIIKGKQVQNFCDIGDLLLHLGETPGRAENAQVRDYHSGEWLPVMKAVFVYAPSRFKTPMGWSMAAFKDRTSAEAYGTAEDLASIMKRIVK